jgi:hypothetical protein
MKDKDLMFQQLKDKNWRTKMALLVDMLEHLNNFNMFFREQTSLYTNYIQQYRVSKQNCFYSQNKVRKFSSSAADK